MRILRIVVILNFVAVLLSCSSKKDKIQSVIGNPENSTDTSALAIGEVIGIGKIEPESRLLPLAAGRGGIVVKVIKGNGDHVVQGETLVILDSETEKVNADLAKARFEAQKHQLALNKNLIAEAEARMNNKKRLLESTI